MDWALVLSSAIYAAVIVYLGTRLVSALERVLPLVADQVDAWFKDGVAMVERKDQKIDEMYSDYKALVESYLRETGKVYVRPVVTASEKLAPPQPSPWRMRPPPPLPPLKKTGDH